MYRACIDIGGTFTDCLVLDDQGDIHEFKSPTTPQDPSLGFLACLEKAAKSYHQSLSSFLAEVDLLIHGTTLATNTLINENGAKTGMITTKNFRDIIEIRRGFKNIRTSMYNVFVPPYSPLVPRNLRLEVEERILASGEILTTLNEAEVQQAVAQLKKDGVQAIAVCFLHSYANPNNEQRATAICKESFDGAYVTASHEILPVWREYERFSTAVVSAYVGPVVERYLRALEKRLRDSGFKRSLLLVLSSGLVETVENCIPRAVFLIGSGPAAAPTGALYLGKAVDHQNLLSIDMGGTSLDVCMIRNGEIPTTTESWVGDERVAIKMVDIHSAGAGGGSIAWIDSLGLLQVGPQSAGADPGPVCYGKGGTQPTVTDADLILGFVPADYFLGGEITLTADLAEKAIRTVGESLGFDVPTTAQTIFTTINSVMADKMTEISTKRGYDVRDFALVVGGGAGPVHGAHLAELLEIPTVIIPRYAATYSAFGMLNMEVGRDFARSIISRKSFLDLERVNRLFAEMEVEGRQIVADLGISPKDTVIKRSLEMRYLGQFHEVEVSEVPDGKIGSKELEEIVQAFHRRHQDLFTFNMPGRDVEFLNARLKATARQDPLKLAEIPRAKGKADEALKRRRSILWNLTEGYEETPIYDGTRLACGHRIKGPAIIEEPLTTVVIPASYVCAVDAVKNYILTRR